MLLKDIRPKNATMNWLYLPGAGTGTSQINANDLTNFILVKFYMEGRAQYAPPAGGGGTSGAKILFYTCQTLRHI